MRCAACRRMPFVKWLWSDEARFFITPSATARMLPEARRERAFSVVQSENRSGGSRAASHGSAEPAGEENMREAVCPGAVGVQGKLPPMHPPKVHGDEFGGVIKTGDW